MPLVTPEKRECSQAQIEAPLRAALSNLPGIKVTVGPSFNPMGGAGDIEVVVMASQFESLREPFIIMFTVPLGGIGVLLTLLLTGSNLGILPIIGVIMP